MPPGPAPSQGLFVGAAALGPLFSPPLSQPSVLLRRKNDGAPSAWSGGWLGRLCSHSGSWSELAGWGLALSPLVSPTVVVTERALSRGWCPPPGQGWGAGTQRVAELRKDGKESPLVIWVLPLPLGQGFPLVPAGGWAFPAAGPPALAEVSLEVVKSLELLV